MNKGSTLTPKSSIKSFTLIELIVVIIIIGILAAVGLTQYSKTVEKGRGAEARMILGEIRTLAVAYRLEHGTVNGTFRADFNIGTDQDQFPVRVPCRSSHYFGYDLGSYWWLPYSSDPVFVAYATRCTAGGKAPQGVSAGTLILTSDLAAGTDTWSGTGGY